MRLSVRHVLRWSFEEPASLTVQVLRLVPRDQEGLTILAWRVAPDRGGPLPGYQDGYGNPTLLLTRRGPHRAVTVTVEGEVETHPGTGALHEMAEPLPPGFFLRDSPATEPDAALRDLPGREAAPLAEALRARIAPAADGAETGAAALAAGRGTPAALVHAFLAASRAAGVPARFVSGYRWPGRNGAEAAAPHPWAETWDAAEGWVAHDVLDGGRIGPEHLRVAAGLDAEDAGPARGVRRGPGAGSFAQSVRVTAA